MVLEDPSLSRRDWVTYWVEEVVGSGLTSERRDDTGRDGTVVAGTNRPHRQPRV